jgi:hypothetical protein
MFLEVPIEDTSAHTNLAGTYSQAGGSVGGAVPAFRDPQTTFEIWFRPGELTVDHGVLFETGGGQNGLGVLVNSNGLRVIGSSANTRVTDVVVPLSGMNLDDFLQLVISIDVTADELVVSLRDTFGLVRTVSEASTLSLGGNGAVFGNWGSGGIGGEVNNLGGRTELEGQSPEGLSGFSGEIALIKVYATILSEDQIGEVFRLVASPSKPPAGGLNAITRVDYDGSNAVSLTWNSSAGTTYDAEFSSNLVDWFPIEQEVTATESETTSDFSIPPNQEKFFFRIIEVTP